MLLATKKFFGFPEDQSFYVPEDALANWRKAGGARRGLRSGVEEALRELSRRQFPELAAEFERTQAGKLQGRMGESAAQLPAWQAGGNAQCGQAP